MAAPRLDKLDKNYIINGNMEYWQRVVGTTTTINTATAQQFRTADRMESQGAGPTVKNFSVLRSTDVPGTSLYKYPYSHQFNCLTAIGSYAAGDFVGQCIQRIEGTFFRDIHQKIVTIGFWIKVTSPSSTFPIQYPVSLRNHDGTRSYVTSVQVDANDTWQFCQKTIQLDLAGVWELGTNSGLIVWLGTAGGSTYTTGTMNQWINGQAYTAAGLFNIMSFNTNVVRVTGLQVVQSDELTRTISSENYPRFGRDSMDELRACQRYYEKSYSLETLPGTFPNQEGMWAFTLTSFNVSQVIRVTTPMKVRKRTAAGVSTIFNPQTGATGSVARDVAGNTSISFSLCNETHVGFEANPINPTSPGDPRFYVHWAAENEL